MSDNYLRIIPTSLRIVPEPDAVRRALDFVLRLLPHSHQVEATTYDAPVFIDQGSNLESVVCPVCGARSPLDEETVQQSWWQGVLAAVDENGPELARITMNCCGATVLFHQLVFDWPAGVAMFEIGVLNPGTGTVRADDLSEIERLLGCSVKQVWAHY